MQFRDDKTSWVGRISSTILYIQAYRTEGVNKGDSDTEKQEMAEQPLVESLSTITELVISQVCGCVSNLANLLPTGTVTVFQLVAPVLTNQGQCDYVNRSLVTVLITLCAIYGFVVTFTDSFRVLYNT